jgi:hypothetical protein
MPHCHSRLVSPHRLPYHIAMIAIALPGFFRCHGGIAAVIGLTAMGCAASHTASPQEPTPETSGMAVLDCRVDHPKPSLMAVMTGNDWDYGKGYPSAGYLTGPSGGIAQGEDKKGLLVFVGLEPGTYRVRRIDERLVPVHDDSSEPVAYEKGNIYEFNAEDSDSLVLRVTAGQLTYLGKLQITGVCHRFVVDGKVTDENPKGAVEFSGKHAQVHSDAILADMTCDWSHRVEVSPDGELHALETLHRHYKKNPWTRLIDARLHSLKSGASAE